MTNVNIKFNLKLYNGNDNDDHRQVTLNTWHKVRFIRSGLEASLQMSLSKLFSYLDTFFRVGLMNLPFMSRSETVSSLIWI